jgi:hypothetical protein
MLNDSFDVPDCFQPYLAAQFLFGPFEWLWRNLTYWKLQPIKKTSVDSGSTKKLIVLNNK